METRDILEKDFYNGVQAAQKLGVNKSRIYALAAQGRFEGAFKAWDSWLIPKLSVDNFQRKPQGNFTNHRRTSDIKYEVSQWLEAAGYPSKKEE